jgi:parallel beta-helix repeat protein
MKKQVIKPLATVLLLGILLGVSGAQAEDAGTLSPPKAPARPTTTCNSCSSCSTKLASELYSEVRLTTDLIDQGGICVATVFGESDNTFNCDGHIIDGDDIDIDPDQGIALLHGSNNTVVNCIVSDFSSGIKLTTGTGNSVQDSVMRSNGYGLELSLATYSTIEGNTIEENFTGIKLYMADNSVITGNRVCNNLVTDFDVASTCGHSGTANQCNIPDSWNDDGTTGCTYPCWTCWQHLPIIAR